MVMKRVVVALICVLCTSYSWSMSEGDVQLDETRSRKRILNRTALISSLKFGEDKMPPQDAEPTVSPRSPRVQSPRVQNASQKKSKLSNGEIQTFRQRSKSSETNATFKIKPTKGKSGSVRRKRSNTISKT